MPRREGSDEWTEGELDDMPTDRYRAVETLENEAVGEPAEPGGNNNETVARIDLLAVRFSPNVRKLFGVVKGLEGEVAEAFTSDEKRESLFAREPLDDVRFRQIMSRARHMVTDSTDGNEYHNVVHMHNNVKNGVDEFIGVLKKIGTNLDEYDVQGMQLAALMHDAVHCGVLGKGYPDFEKNIVPTLTFVNDFMKKEGVSLGMRLDVLCMILATTSFNRDIGPKNPKEVILVMRDIGNFYEGFSAFMKNNLQVMREYVNKPKDFGAWEKDSKWFLGTYCVEKIAEFRDVFERTGGPDRDRYLHLLNEYESARKKVYLSLAEFCSSYKMGIGGELGEEVAEFIAQNQDKPA